MNLTKSSVCALMCLLLACMLGSSLAYNCAQACNRKFTACQRRCSGPKQRKCVLRCTFRRTNCYRLCSGSCSAEHLSNRPARDSAMSSENGDDPTVESCEAWQDDCNLTCPPSNPAAKRSLSRRRGGRRSVRSIGGSCRGTCDLHEQVYANNCNDQECLTESRKWRDECYQYCLDEQDIPGDTCAENCEAYFDNCLSLVPPVPGGGKCIPGKTTCEDGYACASSGTCNLVVTMGITAAADDHANVYISGTSIGQVVKCGAVGAFTYTGPCDDIMVQVENEASSGPEGAAIRVDYDDKVYSTQCKGGSPIEGVIALYGISKANPQGDWYLNKPDYDFSTWGDAVCYDGDCLNDAAAGMEAVSISDQTGDAPKGFYGLRIALPFC